MTQLLLFMVKQFNFIFLGSLRCGKSFDEMGSKPVEFLALVLGYNQRESGNEGLRKEEPEEVTAIDPWTTAHRLGVGGGTSLCSYLTWRGSCGLIQQVFRAEFGLVPDRRRKPKLTRRELHLSDGFNCTLGKPKDLGGSTSVFLKI